MRFFHSIFVVIGLAAMTLPGSAQVVTTTSGKTYLAVVSPINGGGVCYTPHAL